MKWKEAFESKGLEVDLGKTKVMVCSGITQNGMSKSRINACGVCSLRVKLTQYCVYSVVCGFMVVKMSVKGDSKAFRKFYMQKM